MDFLTTAPTLEPHAASIFVEVARLMHLFAIALGLGTIATTTLTTLRRMDLPVTQEFCHAAQSAQTIILPSLILAWFTGLTLIWLDIGFSLSSLTPAMLAKLIVVVNLTVTTIAIRRHVLPALERNIGRTLMESWLSEKFAMGVCTAFSLAGWLSALLLGGIASSDVTPGWLIVLMVFLIHVVVLMAALRSVFTLHDRVQSEVDLVERQSSELRIN